MTLLLVEGPAAEPVSLAEMKAWLKVDASAEDDLIAALVTSARLIVESLTRRLLITQTWRLALDQWATGSVLAIPVAPVASVAAVRVYDAAGAAQILAPSLYILAGPPDRSRIVFVSTPPVPARAVGGIQIDIVVGYGDRPDAVPAPLRQAIRALAARWFEDRGDAMSDPSNEKLPAQVSTLIAPFRRARLA